MHCISIREHDYCCALCIVRTSQEFLGNGREGMVVLKDAQECQYLEPVLKPRGYTYSGEGTSFIRTRCSFPLVLFRQAGSKTQHQGNQMEQYVLGRNAVTIMKTRSLLKQSVLDGHLLRLGVVNVDDFVTNFVATYIHRAHR